MSLFDNSTAVFPKNISRGGTYHSYMCPSKCEYSKKNTKDANSAEKPTWINPQTSVVQDKHFQQNISKLRDILSDTIASLTRENNLKKGESVELTLEIELMKSIENTPTNSLVEVTIIQHNNKGKSNNKLSNKMMFKIEQDQLSMSKSSIHQKQSWFKRVISRENNTYKPSQELSDKKDERCEKILYWKQPHKPLFCPTAKQKYKELENTTCHDTKSNFINILPEETSHNTSTTKDHTKTNQRENKRELVTESNATTGIPKKLNKKISLMKKISDIVIPQKKPSKQEVVENALTALKDEIDNMKKGITKEKHKQNKKRDKTPVHKLGKLVNNVLFDVMENVDDKNKIKEEYNLPLQYQSFFEPVTDNNKRRKKLTKRKTSPSMKKLYRSHSDTCCVRSLKSEIDVKVKSSNSISDCTLHLGTKTSPEAEHTGDTKEVKRRKKRSKPSDYSRSRVKNIKGEKTITQKQKAEDYRVNDIPHHSEMFSRSSLIQWNGQYIKVSKDIKARIEMLIVNELENLALKEGMECDVMPLSSTDDTVKDSNIVEKVSSFICELDISDKSVRKIMKSKKSLHRKVSVHHSPMEMINVAKKNHVPKGRTGTTIASGTQTVPICRKQFLPTKNNNNVNESPTDIMNEVNPHRTIYKQKNPVAPTGNITQESVEIKYMNKNMINWSADSHTTTVYSPEMMPNHRKRYESAGLTGQGKKSNRYISTGFVKIIESDDSSWKRCFTQSDIHHAKGDQLTSTKGLPESNLNITRPTISTTEKSSSQTSNEIGSSIEIELDIQDLEYILKQAKHNYNADKVLIEAKCAHPLQKQKHKAKTSPSYTTQLLNNASKKLEKYATAKTRHKKSK